jgi:prepilin-type N-terminal cleavage/methylation domain-containing protein
MTMRSDRGFTLIELLIVVAIISIIAAIAVPGLLRSRMTASETSALASLQAINKAEMLYATSCGNGGFAVAVPVLGTPPPGTTEAFLPADLTQSATPQKSGYNFTLAAGAGAGAGPNDCNGTATQTAYYSTAVPMTFGSTGARSFASNAGQTIWQVAAGAAPTEPFGAPATPIQ